MQAWRHTSVAPSQHGMVLLCVACARMQQLWGRAWLAGGRASWGCGQRTMSCMKADAAKLPASGAASSAGAAAAAAGAAGAGGAAPSRTTNVSPLLNNEESGADGSAGACKGAGGMHAYIYIHAAVKPVAGGRGEHACKETSQLQSAPKTHARPLTRHSKPSNHTCIGLGGNPSNISCLAADTPVFSASCS